MKITLLEIKNFMAIGEAALSLDDRGLLLLQGENRDDSSAASNGAGKSSVVDAISWCLYGQTARGETGDQVVNRENGKGCRVSVCLQDEDGSYTITRHRKDGRHKNDLTCHFTKDDKTADLTKGTTSLTQDHIEKSVIGCPHDVFRAAVYSGQESMPDLPAMSDRHLKVLVEEAANISLLESAYGIARQRVNEHRAAVKEAEDDLYKVGVKRDALADSIKSSAKRYREWRTWKEEEVESLSNDLARNWDKLGGIEDPASEITKVEKKIDTVTKALEAEETVDEKEVALRKAEDDASTRHIRLTVAIDNQKKLLAKAIKKLSSVKDLVGTPCGECGKEYTEDDLEAASKIATEDHDQELAELTRLTAGLDETNKRVLSAKEALDSYLSSKTSKSELPARYSALQRELDVLMNRHRERVKIKEDIDRVEVERVELEAKKNPYAKEIIEDKRSLKKLDGSLSKYQEKFEKANESLRIAELAAEVYGPAGVRAYILETVTPFLNDQTAQYLATLSDGNLSATWQTLTKTAKGELREKFSIDVSSITAGSTFKSLSGGEKRKVRLACALALQDLVASRATKPIDLWIGDEIDDALDPAGLERLFAVLEAKARSHGTVMIISHNDLNDWIRHAITVVKSGGVASIA